MEYSKDATINDGGKVFRKWQEYILNYFDHYVPNAFTEGIHTQIKLMNRTNYGLKNVGVDVEKMFPCSSLIIIPLMKSHHTFYEVSQLYIDLFA
jgi:hypothetical protein